MKTTNSARILFHIYREVTNVQLFSAQNQTIRPETQLRSVTKKFLFFRILMEISIYSFLHKFQNICFLFVTKLTVIIFRQNKAFIVVLKLNNKRYNHVRPAGTVSRTNLIYFNVVAVCNLIILTTDSIGCTQHTDL